MSHWIYKGEPFDPDYDDIDHAGFVYMITNNITGQKYVGKKVFHARRTLKPLKGKKRRRKVVKESDWRGYCSSSQEVKDDIKKHGKENFTFEILSFHINRTELNYAELKLQFLLDVLEARCEDTGEYLFYNRNILTKYYRSELHWEDRLALHEHYTNLALSKNLIRNQNS